MLRRKCNELTPKNLTTGFERLPKNCIKLQLQLRGRRDNHSVGFNELKSDLFSGISFFTSSYSSNSLLRLRSFGVENDNE